MSSSTPPASDRGDPSTLSALHPAQPRELHYRGYKTSQRLLGSHFMTLKRPSRLPESGREYLPGDPVNLIDWRAFARTDQLIIRELRDEASSRILIGVDLSSTMHWPDGAVPAAARATKAEVALRVALNLAHVHLRMGDLVELWLADDDQTSGPSKVLRPRSTTDVVGAFDRMARREFTREALTADARPEPLRAGARDVAFWIGDALGKADAGAFLALGKRSFFLHVLSSLELDIGWIRGETSYFDEGLARKEYLGAVLRHRDNYLKHLAAWRQKLERRQRRRGGEYLTISDATQVTRFHAALAAFVATREP